MEVLRRWWLAPGQRPQSLIACFLWRTLPHGKADVNQGPMPMGSDMPFAQGGYPTANWTARAAIAAVHEWWIRAAWEFLRTDPAVPAAIRAEATAWGLCADEFNSTGGWPPQLYVRESIRMRGARVMTQADVYGSAYAKDPTSVGMSQWLIDVHAVRRIAAPPSPGFPAWDTVDAGDVNTAGKVWQLTEIPYAALTPAVGDTENLLVPVCASFTHIAFATYRLEPQYMVFGQSAAVAAVLALRAGYATVQEVDVLALQAELTAQGQLLSAQPEDTGAMAAQPCRNESTQVWAYVPADGTLRLSGAAGTFCASIFGYSHESGAAVWAAQCHPPVNASNQLFDLVPAAGGGVQVRARISGRCVGFNSSVPAWHAGGPGATPSPSPPPLVQMDCAVTAQASSPRPSALLGLGGATTQPTNGTVWRVQVAPSAGAWVSWTPACSGAAGRDCLCATSPS